MERKYLQIKQVASKYFMSQPLRLKGNKITYWNKWKICGMKVNLGTSGKFIMLNVYITKEKVSNQILNPWQQ